jgi:DNA polymerase-3 subunit delta
MVAVKWTQVAALVKAPGTRYCAFLLHGNDAGLVSEYSAGLAKAVAALDSPAGELVRLDDADFEDNPDRLSIELLTIPMFGGRKVVRVEMSRRVNAQVLKPLLDVTSMAGVLIVEAGNLKKDDAVRVAFEKSTTAAAIGCYADDEQGLNALIQDVLTPLKISISPGARQQLISRLGADRAMSRGEIEKLALYARGKQEITEDDVEAAVGDAADLTIDRVVNAAAAGEAARAVQELQRALAAGESAQGIILALQRHYMRLHRLRAIVDSGKSVDQTIDEVRPPVHFKQKPALAAQIRLWRTGAVETALQAIANSARSARQSSALEDLLAERLILSLSRLARPQR